MKIRLSTKEKLEIFSNISTMLNAGIPLMEIVSTMEEEAKGNNKKFLAVLREDLAQGNGVSYTMEKLPKTFDPVTVSLVKSAEESGNLEKTLREVKEKIKKDIEFSNKIWAAMIYPALIFLMFAGVLVMILTYVIPRISGVFSKLNVVLPLPTQILIKVSEFTLANFPYVVAAVVALIILLIVLYKTQKRFLVNALFSLPLLSKLALEIDIVRLSGSLSLLLSSGVPISRALDLSQQVVTRKKVRKVLIRTHEMVLAGQKLSEGFKSTKGVFPAMVVRIVEAGEKSGSLDQSLAEISEQYEDYVDNTLGFITTLLEPVMILVIGLLVGGIMLAIIAPIYQLIGSISPR
jgi:type II secretory pathway component PulF